MAKMKTKARRGRGEGSVFQRKDGRWAGTVSAGFDRAGTRIRKSVYGESKAEALAKMDIARRELAKRGSILVEDEKISLSEYLAMWLDELKKPNIQTNTYNGYESAIRVHINPVVGTLKLKKVTPVILQRLYSRLEQDNVGARTRESVHVTLKAALKRAVRLSMIESNPVDQLDRPKQKSKETRALSLEEVHRFVEAAQYDSQRNLYLLILMTGVRPGEAVALKWSDIDLEAGSLSIRRSVEYARGNVAVKDVKSASSRRRIDLTRKAIDVLRDQKKQNLRDERMTGSWIFPDVEDGPFRFWNRRTAFAKVVEVAKLGSFTLYGLRHTFATLALSAGIPLKVVSEQLGHASIKITADTYQHVLPSLQKEAARRLDGVFENVDIFDSHRTAISPKNTTERRMKSMA